MNQTTNSIVMVPPVDFCFNEQTGKDNEFQNRTDLSLEYLRDEVLSEFNEMVNILRDNHIEVLLLNKQNSDPALPDAVFPNNWFATRANGELIIFPMKAKNRQAEVRPQALKNVFYRSNYSTTETKNIFQNNKALEGTGSIIFDHNNDIAYAAISERCDKDLFEQFCSANSYLPVAFETSSTQKKPFYHTNVMMSIGDGFCVICLEAIQDDKDRKKIVTHLEKSNKEIIELSLVQTENNFCANILQLHNKKGERLIVMSQSAYQGFSEKQRKQLQYYGKLVPCPIPTIENIGGGSARCMIAENFLPKV